MSFGGAGRKSNNVSKEPGTDGVLDKWLLLSHCLNEKGSWKVSVLGSIHRGHMVICCLPSVTAKPGP